MKARAFIEAEEPGRRNVSRTCELLEVSKAAYYQASKAVPGREMACSDAQLLAKVITEVHHHSRGHLRLARCPCRATPLEGCACGRNRVARLMKLHRPGGPL